MRLSTEFEFCPFFERAKVNMHSRNAGMGSILSSRLLPFSKRSDEKGNSRARGAASLELALLLPFYIAMLASVVFLGALGVEKVKVERDAREAAWSAAPTAQKSDPMGAAIPFPGDSIANRAVAGWLEGRTAGAERSVDLRWGPTWIQETKVRGIAAVIAWNKYQSSRKDGFRGSEPYMDGGPRGKHPVEVEVLGGGN